MGTEKRRWGLRGKIIAAILLVGSLPIVGGLLLTALKGRDLLRQAIGANFQGLASETARNVDLLMKAEFEVGQFIDLLPLVKTGLRVANERYKNVPDSVMGKKLDREASLWRQDPLFRNDLLNNPLSLLLLSFLLKGHSGPSGGELEYTTSLITDTKGVLIGSINERPSYLQSREPWWQQVHEKGPERIYLSNVFFNDKIKAFAFFLVTPLMDEDGKEVMGFMKREYNIKEFLQPVIHPVRFGATGHAMLIDAEGTVLICPILPTGSHLPPPDLVAKVTATDAGWWTAPDDAHGGHNSIVGFAPLQETNKVIAQVATKEWHSFIRQEPKELYIPVNSLLLYVFGSGTGLLVILTVLGTVVSKKLVGPIRLLHEGANLIGKGNLDLCLTIDTQDEIEDLADEFNRMSKRLKESYSTLEQKVADRTKELATLNLITATVNESLDLQKTLTDSLEKILDVMQLECGAIRLWDAEQRLLRYRASHGFTEEYLREASRLPFSDSISGQAFQAGVPIVISNTDEDPRVSDRMRELGVKSIAAVPIKSKDAIVGTLSVGSANPRIFTTEDLQLLTSIGNQMGTAIENASLYENEKKAVEKLIEMDRFKSEFLANVSHELRTPLTSIIGFSELLLDRVPGQLTADQEEYVKNMQGSGLSLLEIINNLLDISKLRAGKMTLQLSEFFFSDLIEKVKNTVLPLVAKKGLHLDVHLHEEIPHVFADEGKVKQIFLNLLSNAIKFTPSGGRIAIEARPTMHRGQPIVEVAISDTGVGIRQEDIGNIFEEFRQVDSSYTREFQGTGLGLAITKRLLEIQGGTIMVESTPGKGSSFTFILPLQVEGEKEGLAAIAAMERKASDTPGAEKTPLSAGGHSHGSIGKPTILVVEDEPRTSKLLTLILSQEGYHVEHAYDGVEAVERARELRPFAITLDIMLPRRDGWEVLKNLKADPDTRHIPVIIVSIIDNRQLGFSLGAVDYFTKPIDRILLLESVKRYSHTARTVKPICVEVVDHDHATIQKVATILESEGFGVAKCSSAEEGIKMAIEIQPDLILLNLLLSEQEDGIETVSQLKDHPTAKNIPIIVYTHRELTDQEKGSLSGKIRHVIQKGRSFKEDILTEIRKFEKIYPDKAMMIDGLTGFFNMRYLQNRLSDEAERAKRYRRPFSLLLTNVDLFRQYNTTYGTAAGDHVLVEAAKLMRKNTRAAHPLCRCGGSTFALLMTETGKEAAVHVGLKLTGLVEEHSFQHRADQPGKRLTLSAGVSTFFDDTDMAEEMYVKAEAALMEAKRLGGNRVMKAAGGIG